MKKVFVAYPFRKSAQLLLDSVIRPLLTRERLACLTADEPRSDCVAHVRDQIENCDGFIGVITEQNPNVFFEIGIASGLRKPSVLLADSSYDLAMLFDSYPMIKIGDTEAMSRQILTHIRRWPLRAAVALRPRQWAQ